MRIHVAFLAWKRSDYAERTIASFVLFNRVAEFNLCYGRDGWDGAPDPAPEIAWLFAENKIPRLVQHEENEGTARTWGDLISAVAKRADPDDLLLTIEDDWVSARPVPLAAVQGALQDGADVVGLFGPYKESARGCPVDARLKCRECWPDVSWVLRLHAGEQMLRGSAFWCYPPCITRVCLARRFAAGAIHERDAIRRSVDAGVQVAWVLDPVFFHIGKVGWKALGGKR